MTEPDLLGLVAARRARIAIVGLGSVGLPLARAFAEAGFTVLGIDSDPTKLAAIARGETPLSHLGSTFVSELRATGRFEATGDPTHLRAGAQAVGWKRADGKRAELAHGAGRAQAPDAARETIPTSRGQAQTATELAREPSNAREIPAAIDSSRGIDIAILCVPTPLGPEREPDLECVLRASRHVAANLRRGALVVVESTSYPGTTRTVVGDVFRAHGFEPGRDVFLAYSPERENPGGDVPTTAIPKLVGGTCDRSGDLAQKLYEQAFERVVRVSSAEVAESAKLLENVYRAVNIALVNELKVALDAMKIDVWEAIDAAATKPFGFQKFTPGPGMGGHCIPVDPFYLSWIARRHGVETRFIELAGVVNREMPVYVVERTRQALASMSLPLRGARILVLGLAYKPDVDIVTESPSIRILELLAEAGAEARYSDPHVRPVSPASPASAAHDRCRGEDLTRVAAIRLGSVDLTKESIAAFDVLIIATEHRAFDWELVAAHARLVVDTRHALASRMRGSDRYFGA